MLDPLLVRIEKLHAAGRKALAVLPLSKDQDYFDELADLLRAHILGKQGDLFAEHLEGILASVDDGLSMAATLRALEEDLGERLSEITRDRVERLLTRAYSRGQIDIRRTSRWDFSQTDERIAGWLARDTGYWVGAHWGDSVTTAVQGTLAEHRGESRVKIVEALQEELSGMVRRSNGYWSNMANHVTTRARSFGITEGLVQIGAKVGIFDAVLDSRTSDVCRHMDGKKILVSDMVELRDRLVDAQDPEAVRTLQDWTKLNPDQITQDTVDGRPPIYASLPPLHFGCRSHIIFVDG